jgi:hypothetical protein
LGEQNGSERFETKRARGEEVKGREERGEAGIEERARKEEERK